MLKSCLASMPSAHPSVYNGEEPETQEGRKVDIIGSDETCLTFKLHGEDHTLANALRYVLMKNVDVEFCGYSIPHPSDDFVNIRVQTLGKPAVEVFRQALHDLMTMSESVSSTFQVAVENSAVTQ
jgi:DNA-directed RNA polymerases I and III subunit RPAC2